MFNKTMGLLNKLKRFWASFTPRYNLCLDSSEYAIDSKHLIHRFKVYGSHNYVKFTYEEIMRDRNLTYQINPYDLIDIAVKERDAQKKKSIYIIKKTLRNNYFKVCNAEGEHIIDGDELCHNPILIKQMSPIDLHNISYNTGFIHGRRLSKTISESSKGPAKPSLRVL
ncbi:MAG: hypothetical protein COV52_07860 [Gammaproteobacteria bacterium CG11_big_fil_rev_8_21_14_0_20_46_22]|nr:MAG: hypothetical protein COW05_03940 [Gammaproteobacteria bacterium CG12_big_fil_rev_8_21_14_0_65_46_12]PIR10672.1 MAG: hypothetical protein COV52_07860 [Gammaproteobacteria bacterium CG11_big_fil_rev_8_21_14_0_20_46_22]